jgi:hypothetical protein
MQVSKKVEMSLQQLSGASFCVANSSSRMDADLDLLEAVGYRVIRSATESSKMLEAYDDWLLDCDGVLWAGSSLIPGAMDTLDSLRYV